MNNNTHLVAALRGQISEIKNDFISNNWEYIQERRFQAAIERFQDYEGDEMEIPELEKSIERKRLDACILRYAGMIEHMVMPDMDIWMKLKFEIITYRFVGDDEDEDDDDDDRDEQEYRYLCFKDKYC